MKNNSSYKVGHIPIDGVTSLINGRFLLGSFTLSHRSCKIVGAHLVPDFLFCLDAKCPKPSFPLGVVLSVGFWRLRITKKKWKTFLRFEHPNFNKWRCHIFGTLFHSEPGKYHIQLGRSDSNYPTWGNDFQVFRRSFSREQTLQSFGVHFLKTNTFRPWKIGWFGDGSFPLLLGRMAYVFMGYMSS